MKKVKKKKVKKPKKVNKAKLVRKLKKQNFDLWSKCVRLRDKRCIICGSTENLQAHHCFVRAAASLRARFVPDNGITLCYKCHLIEIHRNGEKRFFEKYIKALDDRVPYFRQQEIYRIAENDAPVTLEELQDINTYLKNLLQELQDVEIKKEVQDVEIKKEVLPLIVV